MARSILYNDGISIQHTGARYADKAPVTGSITLPIEKGDDILTGHWKNHKEKIKSITTDDKGQPLVNDRPLLNVRIPKLMEKTSTKIKDLWGDLVEPPLTEPVFQVGDRLLFPNSYEKDVFTVKELSTDAMGSEWYYIFEEIPDNPMSEERLINSRVKKQDNNIKTNSILTVQSSNKTGRLRDNNDLDLLSDTMPEFMRSNTQATAALHHVADDRSAIRQEVDCMKAIYDAAKKVHKMKHTTESFKLMEKAKKDYDRLLMEEARLD